MPAARVPAYCLTRDGEIVLDPVLRDVNPGSEEAVENGCSCPVIDNRHGRGYRGRAGEFIYDLSCPIHGEAE